MIFSLASARVFLQLLYRDFLSFKKRFVGVMIDNTMLLAADGLLFVYLLPRMGMPKNFIGPIFIGTVLMCFFSACHGMTVALVEDLKHTRYIDYYASLPISTHWVVARYIVRYMFEASCIFLPLLFVGSKLLGDKFMIVQSSPLSFLIIFLLAALFFSSFFLMLGFRYDYDWYWANVWSKRIEPVLLFGAIFVIWKKLYIFSPFWGIVFLLNPVTYIVEGVRAAMIGGDAFLPFWICVIGTSVGIVINFLLLLPSVKRALDHV